jgi:hypothetical protein
VILAAIPWGRKARVIKPLQRIYDQPGLARLFAHWTKQDENWYCRGDDGCWTPVLDRDALKLENPHGDSAMALLELSPVK